MNLKEINKELLAWAETEGFIIKSASIMVSSKNKEYVEYEIPITEDSQRFINEAKDGLSKAPMTPPIMRPVPKPVASTEPEKTPCCGQDDESFLQKVKSLASGVTSLTAALVGIYEEAGPEEQSDRQRACSACTETDTKGERLFRLAGENLFTCGVLGYKDLLRNTQKDGCGCFLNLKWKMKDQHCPLEKPKW